MTAKSNRRSTKGTTIIELLVAAVVTGIAIAGITELLWINTTWSNRLLNKTDNLNQTKFFQGKIQSDIRAARNLGDATNQEMIFAKSGKNFALGPTTLIMQIPLFDSNGFPVAISSTNPICDSDTVVYYEVQDDRDSTGSTYQIKRCIFRGQSDSTAGDVIDEVVLNDIVGPQNNIFEYVDENGALVPTAATSWPAACSVSGISINLQLNRTGASNVTINKNAIDKSNMIFKTENFMRNRLLI